MNKKLLKIHITELLMVKADLMRTFIGEIRREVDINENPLVLGEVIVHEGKIWSKASTHEELMRNMDGICLMKLDFEIHSHRGRTYQIFHERFNLN